MGTFTKNGFGYWGAVRRRVDGVDPHQRVSVFSVLIMRKYVLYLLSAATLTFSPFVIFSWWAEPIYGDLTRIGRWTERDFGPNSPIPSITVKSSGEILDNADVMVLGDSFSQRNLWQSVFSEGTKHVVKTYGYGQSNCIPTFIETAITNTTNKIVVIETVERSFTQRFSHIPSCSNSSLIPSEIKAETIGGIQRPKWPLSLGFWYTMTAAINTIRSNIFNEENSNRYQTVNTRLSAGCALFSNRRNDRFLYYADDDLKRQWSEKEVRTAIANVLDIQNQVERSGKQFVLLIAPDKSSVYQSCIPANDTILKNQSINQLLIDAGVNTPNLQSVFRENIGVIVDLYDPDNTHWSESGYILAGEIIGNYVSGLQAKHGDRNNFSSKNKGPKVVKTTQL